VSIIISPKVRNKLATEKKPPVSFEEIEQCFADRDRSFLYDTRDKNRSIPPTQWFISSTDMGRVLKVVFIELENGNIIIRTAYEPNNKEKEIYNKYSFAL
jgi:uncharacterized DUF497 family protein